MPGKKGGTKRGAEAVADASAKKGRRASEADVALRLGDELGEHTIVSLANIILLKIAADLGLLFSLSFSAYQFDASDSSKEIFA